MAAWYRDRCVAQPILVIGYGSVGRRHSRNLQALGEDSLLFLRTLRGQPQDETPPPGRVVTNIDDALAQKPRAAIIATPSSLHLEHAFALARTGCHLFIDKPLAGDDQLERCIELAHVASEHRVITMIGCQFRFHPLLIALKQGLGEGRIGHVISARAEWGSYLPDWHPWEDHRRGYAARADLGGGALLTLIHPIDYLYWLFGSFSRVRAATRTIASLETTVADDWVDVSIDFTSGVIAHAHMDLVQKPEVHGLTVWGDRGRALFDYHRGELTWLAPDKTATVERVPEGFDRNDMFLAEMRSFLASITAGRPSEIPIGDGIETLRIVAAARRDAALGGQT